MEMKELLKIGKEISLLGKFLTLASWDQETETPEGGQEGLGEMMEYLSGLYYAKSTDPVLKEGLEQLSKEELSVKDAAIVRNMKEGLDRMAKIPQDEYLAYQRILTRSQSLWAKAKRENNFDMFKDALKEIVSYEKKFAGYTRTDEACLYDVVLNQYEKGFTTAKLNEFFCLLKNEIVPLLKKIQESGIDYQKPYEGTVDADVQEKYNKKLAEYIGFDLNRGVIKRSEHPFTTGLSADDVRFTNHYYEDKLESAIFSTIHEGGHGMYEQGVSKELEDTAVAGGASMGVHESQSRFYENLIGRSKSFWNPIFSDLNDAYGLKMNLDDFMNYINRAEASLIRTEADELTYSLHIMIRYELEQMLFNDEIEVEDLPCAWNQKVKDFLGIDVPNDAMGVLQDVHWSGGMFGYFPSYAIGSAIASQIMAAMKKELDVEDLLMKGDLKQIKDFLDYHIHQHGSIYTTNELLNKMMNEEFNPQYYVDYLKEKYTKLYHLD
ncbi:MAG: carboxypeptidase M32 [Erysipelotrichaceae bacterium]|nr:carboxypeptidase M32 [Erysipelotrichaceae bacterium]